MGHTTDRTVDALLHTCLTPDELAALTPAELDLIALAATEPVPPLPPTVDADAATRAYAARVLRRHTTRLIASPCRPSHGWPTPRPGRRLWLPGAGEGCADYAAAPPQRAPTARRRRDGA